MLFTARLLSHLLHPLLMPLLSLWVMLRVDPHVGYFLPPSGRMLLLGMVAIMTFIFPVMSVLLLRRAGLITDLHLPRREERIVPYLMTLLYTGMALYLLFRTPLHPIAYALFIGILCAMVVSAITTFWWKISAHMVGIGGCIGAVAALDALHRIGAFVPLALLLLLAGALGTARLLTSDHTSGQVYSGAALGFASVFATVLWMPAWPF